MRIETVDKVKIIGKAKDAFYIESISVLHKRLNALLFSLNGDDNSLIRTFTKSISHILGMPTMTQDKFLESSLQTISELIDVKTIIIGIIERNEFKTILELSNGQFSNKSKYPISKHPCGIMHRRNHTYQFTERSISHYKEQFKDFEGIKTFLGVPIQNSHGQHLGSICIMDDQRNGFNEIEISFIEMISVYIGNDLYRRVLENQLKQSQEMRLLGQLTSGVAHEVRNPLNGILAITEALNKDMGENHEFKIYTEHIRKQVLRLSDLMRDLLNLGKPIDCENLVPVNIKEIITGGVNSWRNSTIYKNHKIKICVTEMKEIATLFADRSKMEQVIINLLENACAHSPPEKDIKITIMAEDMDLAVIKIIDQGTGIKPEHLEHLFEPFFTTRKGGTGLGLGIVKRIVESHGGVIEIRNNTPAPGLTAEIRLPVISL